MYKRNIISSCLLSILSFLTFILVIIFYSSESIDEMWVLNTPLIYLILIPVLFFISDLKENKAKKQKRPKSVKMMIISVSITFAATIIYCILHFTWFAPQQYDMPPAAFIPIPTYVAIIVAFLPIIGVLLSSRMYEGKTKEIWRKQIITIMFFLFASFGIVFIGLATRVIPKMRLDTDLFFNFSSPVILSLLSLILSILIFHLKDRDEDFEKEALIKS